MSAIGAVSGNGVYSTLTYKGREFSVAQWYGDAMDAVCTTAYRAAGQASAMLGGDLQAMARREAALARLYAIGHFNFEALTEEGGLDNTPELLAVFLFKLLHRHDGTVTLDLAREMVKNAKDEVVAAVKRSNPQNAPSNEPATAGPGGEAPAGAATAA